MLNYIVIFTLIGYEKIGVYMNTELRAKFDSYNEVLTSGLELINDLATEEWSLTSTKLFCENKNIIFDEVEFNSYAELQQTKETFSELYDKLYHVHEKLTDILKSSTKWNEYNGNYKQYFTSNLENICNCLSGLLRICDTRAIPFVKWINQSATSIKQLNQRINSNINEFIEQFKYGNKNYVVFGKNGAGKTTLLGKISKELFEANSVVIPANRQVNYRVSDSALIKNSYSLNQKLSDTSNALHYLTRAMCNKSLAQYKNHDPENSIISSQYKQIFESLSLDRVVFDENDQIFLSTEDGGAKYSLEKASDGERTVVYMILAILLSPDNAFVFIDEPETHLNGALMRNLFDELELSRPDIKFIYLTHNIDFIESRKNAELIYLEKTDKHLQWKFNKIENYSDLSLDVILSIEGMGSTLLFCEGDNRNSIDSKILQSLYHDFEIVPVGSCKKVIENTKGINGKSYIFKRRAFGVVDNDYRLVPEIDALKKDNVEVLTYNEWENLLLDSQIVEKINSELFDNDITNIKEKLMAFVIKNRDQVVTDYINKCYYNNYR